MEHSKLKSIYQDGISHLPYRFPPTPRRIPFSCSETCPLTLCMSNNLGVQFDVPLFIGGTATRRAHARIACRESRHLLCSLNMLVRKDFGTTKWTPKLKNIQTRLISCIHINRRKKTVENAVSQFRT